MESGWLPIDPGAAWAERLTLTRLSGRSGLGARSSLWMNRVLDAMWLMAVPAARDVRPGLLGRGGDPDRVDDPVEFDLVGRVAGGIGGHAWDAFEGDVSGKSVVRMTSSVPLTSTILNWTLCADARSLTVPYASSVPPGDSSTEPGRHSWPVRVDVSSISCPLLPSTLIGVGSVASNPGQLRMAVTRPSTVDVWAGSRVPFVGSHGSFVTRPTSTNMTPQPAPSGASAATVNQHALESGPGCHATSRRARQGDLAGPGRRREAVAPGLDAVGSSAWITRLVRPGSATGGVGGAEGLGAVKSDGVGDGDTVAGADPTPGSRARC